MRVMAKALTRVFEETELEVGSDRTASLACIAHTPRRMSDAG